MKVKAPRRTLMSAKEFRAALDTLELNQLSAGRFLRRGARTIRHWALGETDVPDPVAKLLRVMVTKRIKPSDVWDL